MALSTDPVFFCDPCSKEHKKSIGERYTVLIKGRTGTIAYTVDACEGYGPRTTDHSLPILNLARFLAEHGEEIPGALMLLPGETIATTHPQEAFKQEIEAPKADTPIYEGVVKTHSPSEEPVEVPTGDEEEAPSSVVFKSTPHVPGVTFSTPPLPSLPPIGKRTYPESLHALIKAYCTDNNLQMKDLAEMAGIEKQVLYSTSRGPISESNVRYILYAMDIPNEDKEELVLRWSTRPAQAKVLAEKKG